MKEPQFSYRAITPKILELIKEEVGPSGVIADPEKLQDFSRDASNLERMPDAVVEVKTTAEVQAVFRLANKYRFPVTPRGLGTGLAGGAVPIFGGIVLSLAKMNRILQIDNKNLIAVVEPGVINLELKEAAREKGLYYPPDPASLDTCSIGGNAATNAGGSCCVKYGTTRDYVIGLEAVLPSGEVIQTGVHTRKGVVGYDLTHLIVGSEGTLAVITRLVLRLLPYPKAVNTIVALFPDLSTTMTAVLSIIAQGFLPCALEFLDGHCLELVGALLPFDGVREAGAFLLVQADGAAEVVDKEIEKMGMICLENNAIDVLLAQDSYKRKQMWEVRRQVSIDIERSCAFYVAEDIVVPVARIAELVGILPEFEMKYGVKIYAFGHAGDGNIHLNITAGRRDEEEKVEEAIDAILKRVVSMNGTISGEHGIGYLKKRYLPLELSSSNLRLQRGIKRLFDPYSILNPGKVFD